MSTETLELQMRLESALLQASQAYIAALAVVEKATTASNVQRDAHQALTQIANARKALYSALSWVRSHE